MPRRFSPGRRGSQLKRSARERASIRRRRRLSNGGSAGTRRRSAGLGPPHCELIFYNSCGGQTVMAKQYLLWSGVIALIGATSLAAQQQRGEVRTAKPISQSD